MRRVLVPLDGSDLAAAILPDARRLAGPDGELILVRDASVAPRYQHRFNVEATLEYLRSVAEHLRIQGVSVKTQMLYAGDAAIGIDEAARILHADMIAIATHGNGLTHRLLWGAIAWRALAHSPVPVLLRHVDVSTVVADTRIPRQRHILVPLDGSNLAEKALPLADELAHEWRAAILLVQVVPDLLATLSTDSFAVPYNYDIRGDIENARHYLERAGAGLTAPAGATVVTGSTVQALEAIVRERSITDIVMASHGRTGLSRVILGSLADVLIQRLTLPIIVIPALAGGSGKLRENGVSAVPSLALVEPRTRR